MSTKSRTNRTNEHAINDEIFSTPKKRNFRFENLMKDGLVDDNKTPHQIRNKVKQEISKSVQESTDSELSEEEEDYESSLEENEKEKYAIEVSQEEITSSITKRPTTRTMIDECEKNYVPECEGYFTAHSNTKALTSNHALNRLKNPRLSTDRLFNILSTLQLSNCHENTIASLLDEYKTYFLKWMYILLEGYNIILYGLGSKRKLLQAFHKEVLSNHSVIVINGFFPDLTIKYILNAVSNDILNLDLNSTNHHEVIDVIEKEFSLANQIHLFIILHNIDGFILRNNKSQDILCRLAKIPNIHLITSIDHFNVPLLWDQTNLSCFSFSWWDVTTMLSYSVETAYENSLLVQNSGELALSSLRNVFQSLTTNARKIYIIIVQYQLKHEKQSNYPGIQFKDLYWSCREAFLVSSDLALRAQLTEFLDHKLIKIKRTIDGSEHLLIPIKAEVLQQFISEREQ